MEHKNVEQILAKFDQIADALVNNEDVKFIPFISIRFQSFLA